LGRLCAFGVGIQAHSGCGSNPEIAGYAPPTHVGVAQFADLVTAYADARPAPFLILMRGLSYTFGVVYHAYDLRRPLFVDQSNVGRAIHLAADILMFHVFRVDSYISRICVEPPRQPSFNPTHSCMRARGETWNTWNIIDSIGVKRGTKCGTKYGTDMELNAFPV
jgi:hypothetical protein